MAAWVISPCGDKVFDVVHAGRQLRAGLTLDTALLFVRKRKQAGDKVFLEERDGYRIPIR